MPKRGGLIWNIAAVTIYCTFFMLHGTYCNYTPGAEVCDRKLLLHEINKMTEGKLKNTHWQTISWGLIHCNCMYTGSVQDLCGHAMTIKLTTTGWLTSSRDCLLSCSLSSEIMFCTPVWDGRKYGSLLEMRVTNGIPGKHSSTTEMHRPS